MNNQSGELLSRGFFILRLNQVQLKDDSLTDFENSIIAYNYLCQWFHNVFSDIMKLWSMGYVQTVLASFNHVEDNKYTIIWDNEFKNGVKSYDMYIRNYSRGLIHLNIIIVGGHPLGRATLIDLEHCTKVEKDANGFSLLANSLVQFLIIFVNSIVTLGDDSPSTRQMFSVMIISTFLKFFNSDEDVNHFANLTKRSYNCDPLFDEAKKALVTDRIKTFPFVALVEKFILSNRLLINDTGLTELVDRINKENSNGA